MRRSLPLLLCSALAAAALTALGAAPASAATSVPGDPLAGSGAVTRSVLTAAQLATSSTPSATVSNDAFALPANGAAPSHLFERTLTLNGIATAGGFRKVKDSANHDSVEARKHLPPFSVQLVQNGSHLVPVARGLQYTGSPVWNLEVGAGRAGTRPETEARPAPPCPSPWSSGMRTACTTACSRSC